MDDTPIVEEYGVGLSIPINPSDCTMNGCLQVVPFTPANQRSKLKAVRTLRTTMLTTEVRKDKTKFTHTTKIGRNKKVPLCNEPGVRQLDTPAAYRQPALLCTLPLLKFHML